MVEFLSHIAPTGQDIMLILLSIRWIASVCSVWRNASISGRSLLFDGLCLLAYGFGLAHYIGSEGDDWATSLTGVIYLVNIGMIATLIFLILIIRNAISRVRALR